MTDMKISNELELLETSILIPYARNSRTHSDTQVQQIASSIKEFGFTNPILIDETNGIIAGHGRLLAAQLLKIKSVPCIRLGYLSESQKRAYVIADNKLALNAGWDDELLSLELRDLQLNDFDLSLTGFNEDELAKLLVEAVEGQTDPDDVPEVQETAITVLGDIWTLGNHRLMCGDSTSIDTVEKLMDGQKANMVFTDPPYGVEYQSNMRIKSEKFDVIKNDDKFLDISPIIEMFSNGWVFVWTSWKVQNKWINLFEDFGYPTNIVIWHKHGGGIGDLKRTFSSDYEVALVWHRGAELCGKRIGSVWSINKDAALKYIHPTQKPVSLSEEAIDKTTKINSLILDLFGGSGSTLIGAEKTNRKSYLMELDPKYCDLIIRRWQNFTGRKAVHIETEKTFEEMSDERSNSSS
jgi:DNA modification methylase